MATGNKSKVVENYILEELQRVMPDQSNILSLCSLNLGVPAQNPETALYGQANQVQGELPWPPASL